MKFTVWISDNLGVPLDMPETTTLDQLHDKMLWALVGIWDHFYVYKGHRYELEEFKKTIGELFEDGADIKAEPRPTQTYRPDPADIHATQKAEVKEEREKRERDARRAAAAAAAAKKSGATTGGSSTVPSTAAAASQPAQQNQTPQQQIPSTPSNVTSTAPSTTETK